MDLTGGTADLVLRQVGLAVLCGALVVGALVWWSRRPEPEPLPGEVLVAHTSRLRELPRFRVLVRRRLLRTALQTLALLFAVAGCLLLVARPTVLRTVEQQPPNRDIVLCLDASGSMSRYNAEVVRALQSVVESLPGDRVGLTLFNGATVVKFPLTDDRDFVAEQLAEAERAFADNELRYVTATDTVRSSQLGDGLAACVTGFDRLDEDRGRVILVASDNRPFGRPVHTVAEAATQAVDRDVVVHGLGVPALRRDPAAERELRRAVERTGGTLSFLDSESAVAGVVARVDRLERRRLAEPPREVMLDEPGGALALAAAGLLAFVLVSAVGRRP
ncbi:vWA domain-containing protein [Nocardioides ferulae]|uniref:vWA domain-containing protein n=1 Tax=Nocardioides ferulae TaxID=2340821 RepID=UPI000EAEFCCC|nr:vWA domain-containing protein [Nocardioides ferulae]